MVPEGEPTVAEEGAGLHGSWQLEQEAERSYLQPQAESRESKLQVGWDCEPSKPTARDLLPPAVSPS